MKSKLITYLSFLLTFYSLTAQQINPSQLVATDALNRTLPTYNDVGDKRPNKLVGIFYYIWHGAHSREIYDITEILKKNPKNPKFGPLRKFHFWGEPEYGYYKSDDPWVIRNDLQMLANADIDFMFFDVTNNKTYLNTVKEICKISSKMRAEGVKTPSICFLSNSKSGRVLNELYDEFYSKNLYKNLWFYWNNKPLVMGQPNDPVLRPEVKKYFTIKYSWAWTKSKTEPNHWQWIDNYPQDYGWSTNPEIPEQITVSVASHPTRAQGKSFHNGKQPKVNDYYVTPVTEQGLFFEEQWKRALQVDPQIIMITQWNEWLAQRFSAKKNLKNYAGKPLKKGKTFFVDVFTSEFNRDIAPMKSGYTDNYYYQMVANIRKFKGLEKPQKYSSTKTIKIDNNFQEWETVFPIYKDFSGDTEHRDHEGFDPYYSYKNKTGRNDIIDSKVTNDNNYVYFYAKTKEDLSKHSKENWMLLFIDIDKDKSTGWEGYDYIINHDVKNKNTTTLKKWNQNKWEEVSKLDFSYKNNEIEIAVPVKVIKSKSFYFHWADNPTDLDDISSFFLDGDSAPDRRFNYSYK
jgi:hypothetical protein